MWDHYESTNNLGMGIQQFHHPQIHLQTDSSQTLLEVQHDQ